MSIVFVVLGVGFLAGGAYAVVEGWPYLLIERGFTLVIIGTILMTAGVVMLALSRVMIELGRVRSQLGNAVMGLSLATMAGPAETRGDRPHGREPAGGTGLSDLGAPLGGALAAGGVLAGAVLSMDQDRSRSVLADAPQPAREDQSDRSHEEPDLFHGQDLPAAEQMATDPATDPATLDMPAGDLPAEAASAGVSDRQLEDLQLQLQERLRLPQQTWLVEPPADRASEEATPHASQASVPDPWTETDPPLRDDVQDEDGSRSQKRPDDVDPELVDPFEAILASSRVERDVQPPSRIDAEFDRLRDSLAPLAADRQADQDRALDLAGDWMSSVRPGQERWSTDAVALDTDQEPAASPGPEPADMAPWPPQRRDVDAFEADAQVAHMDRPPVESEPSETEPAAAVPLAAGDAWPSVKDDMTADAQEPDRHQDDPGMSESVDDAGTASVHDTPAEVEPVPPATSDEGVVGAYQVGSAHFTIFADGSINARTPEGDYSFASMEELKVYLASEKSRIGI